MKYYSIKGAMPEKGGVYFVCTKDRKVIYIGKAFRLRARFSSHNRMKDFIAYDACYIYVLFIDNKDIAIKYETFYIRKYRPILNKTLTRIKRRENNSSAIELNPFTLEPL